MLGLPAHITTCLFDLDGVLTQTAKIHAQAWKEMFDDFLRDWAERHGEPFEPFDRPTDYDEYVDGLPRLDGVRSFLESRGGVVEHELPGRAGCGRDRSVLRSAHRWRGCRA